MKSWNEMHRDAAAVLFAALVAVSECVVLGDSTTPHDQNPTREQARRTVSGRESWERRKQKELENEERRARTVRARVPLRYPAKPGERIAFAGHEMGKVYPPPVNGQTVFYVDVVNHYRPWVALDAPYHGMQHLLLNLSPTSHRLFHMGMSRGDFKSRQELRDFGLALLEDFGNAFGRKLTDFRFEAPDWPYWPSRHGIWGGSKPELYVVDESLWPTSKNIFAISDTYVGSCLIQMKLSVVNFTEYDFSMSLHDEEIAAASDSEFVAAFRSAHDGKDYHEWWNERQNRLAQEKHLGEQRCNSTNRLEHVQVQRNESTVGGQQK